MARTASFTRQELEAAYPQLAKAFLEIISRPPAPEQRKLIYSLRKNYAGTYSQPNGELRRTRLDKIIEMVEGDGSFELSINVKPKTSI